MQMLEFSGLWLRSCYADVGFSGQFAMQMLGFSGQVAKEVAMQSWGFLVSC